MAGGSGVLKERRQCKQVDSVWDSGGPCRGWWGGDECGREGRNPVLRVI